ncbi:MAG: DUF6125 family protein [Proteobacteria bacterium]|nr:DUF6125 family protein [Pseudomonadota bacterium]
MDLGILENLEKEELKGYLKFLLWHYRVVDGFWFLCVEEKYDRAAAEYLDEAVWGKIAGMSAKDIVSRFHIKEKGLKGFAKAMQFCPWTMIVGYLVEEKEDEVIVSAPRCVTQVARVKRGLPEFYCRDMHQREFESFAHAVDKGIKVECIFAPPDHPADCFCKWRFSI